MLPHTNGIDVCKILRDKDVNTPIILLTARDKLQDVYINKTFTKTMKIDYSVKF